LTSPKKMTCFTGFQLTGEVRGQDYEAGPIPHADIICTRLIPFCKYY